jgi:transcriptional regulator with XRE-family HTH domain
MSSQGGKNPFPNQLWRARKRRGLGQKQVAYLIEKTTTAVSRYEHGVHLPDLQVVLALEIVYGTPLRLLFPELHEQTRALIAERIKSRRSLRLKCPDLLEHSDPEQGYCGYEEMIKMPHLSATERTKVRSHVTRLAKWLAGLEP